MKTAKKPSQPKPRDHRSLKLGECESWADRQFLGLCAEQSLTPEYALDYCLEADMLSAEVAQQQQES